MEELNANDAMLLTHLRLFYMVNITSLKTAKLFMWARYHVCHPQ